MNKNKSVVDPIAIEEIIKNKIYMIRGEKVMLDFDLAMLYQVEAKVLNQAVKRNFQRFPPDFVFKLSTSETLNLKSQSVTSSWGGARRSTPSAFTEQGIAMLSSVLRSDRAVQVNIQIMRIFARLRQLLSTYKELKEKIELLEKKYDGHLNLFLRQYSNSSPKRKNRKTR
jgi:hypothetical protein